MNLDQLIDQILREGVAPAEMAHHFVPARPARTAPLPADLDPRVRAALGRRGVQHLYSHQLRALEAARAGRDAVIVTPTASGKTLCYNLPVVDALVADGRSRALYLFPTKALAQDQRSELSTLLDEVGCNGACYTYDGDTPGDLRTAIREAGHVVITNPDMLHAAILPHHARWLRLFENLRFVIVDELHTYRGVFGSHLANVLRRLLRIAAFYGSRPTFLCTSATIRNPGELAAGLLGREALVIDDNGAPSGPRHFLFYNPPVVHRALGVRRGAVGEAVAWARRLLENDVATIVFARSRLQTELILSYLQRGLPSQAAATVRGYRGGYLPRERRAVERGLRDGSVRGVVSTNALELGIDIGSLQAAVLCGYPGSIASTWQQAGRAGRRAETALTVLVAGNGPLDQFLVSHPEYLMGTPPESAFIHPENLYVLVNHLKCAAFELPFDGGEAFGPGPTGEMLDFLASERVLRLAGGAYHWMTDHFPAQDVSLRGGDGNVVIVDTTVGGRPTVIGEIDLTSAMLTVYEEAIYLHGGVQYQVERYDEAENKAYVREVSVDYYTEADLDVGLQVLDVFRQEGPAREPATAAASEPAVAAVAGPPAPPASPDDPAAADTSALLAGAEPRHGEGEAGGTGRSWGEVLVTARAATYKKIKMETHENLGWGRIHLPERNLHTTAYWLTLPPALEAALGREALAEGLAGLARALGALAPLHLLCDSADVHTLAQVRAPFTGVPTIFLWEAVAGGVGLAEKAFLAHDQLLVAAGRRIAACPCASGCPSCVGPGSSTATCDRKRAARTLVAAALGGPEVRA